MARRVEGDWRSGDGHEPPRVRPVPDPIPGWLALHVLYDGPGALAHLEDRLGLGEDGCDRRPPGGGSCTGQDGGRGMIEWPSGPDPGPEVPGVPRHRGG